MMMSLLHHVIRCTLSRSRLITHLTQFYVKSWSLARSALINPRYLNNSIVTTIPHVEGQRVDPTSLIMMAAMGVVMCSFRDNERDLLLAAKNNDIKTIQRLTKGADINIRHPLGWTALHTAVINNNMSAVKVLVSAGADVNVQDDFSSARRIARQVQTTPSQVIALRDDEFCSFINHNTSYSGFTPLHYAIITDNEALIQYLLDNGADPNIEDNAGRTPINYCTNESIRAKLEHYSNKIKEQKLREKLRERCKFPLEDKLRQHLVGQEGPITAVAAAIRRREMGWGDNEHPLVFLFLGSSGIGKTELAKQVANYLHKENPKGFIRLDMSEYQEKHEVAKLIGAPPGYIGYEQGGQLTSRLKECPTAVVLFDEVDKAHPDVLTVLLQLFDEGRLTDGHGKTIYCKDAIFVMTSNLASTEIADHALRLRKEASLAVSAYKNKQEPEKEVISISREFKEDIVEPILKHHFHRDEFLGRINDIVYFLPFSRSELNKLVEQELITWQHRAAERHSIKLSWDKEVLDILADGYNVKYGARSIHHEVEREVVNRLALAYEQQEITRGSQVHLIVKTNEEKGSVIGLKVSSGTLVGGVTSTIM